MAKSTTPSKHSYQYRSSTTGRFTTSDKDKRNDSKYTERAYDAFTDRVTERTRLRRK